MTESTAVLDRPPVDAGGPTQESGTPPPARLPRQDGRTRMQNPGEHAGETPPRRDVSFAALPEDVRTELQNRDIDEATYNQWLQLSRNVYERRQRGEQHSEADLAEVRALVQQLDSLPDAVSERITENLASVNGEPAPDNDRDVTEVLAEPGNQRLVAFDSLSDDLQAELRRYGITDTAALQPVIRLITNPSEEPPDELRSLMANNALVQELNQMRDSWLSPDARTVPAQTEGDQQQQEGGDKKKEEKKKVKVKEVKKEMEVTAANLKKAREEYEAALASQDGGNIEEKRQALEKAQDQAKAVGDKLRAAKIDRRFAIFEGSLTTAAVIFFLLCAGELAVSSALTGMAKKR